MYFCEIHFETKKGWQNIAYSTKNISDVMRLGIQTCIRDVLISEDTLFCQLALSVKMG